MPALLATVAVGFAGFALLLPVVPMWVTLGGADESGAGLVTATLMLTTILSQLRVHRLLERIGWTRTLTTAVILLGVPPLVHAMNPNLLLALGASAVRGLGFGTLTVCGATALTLLVPSQLRGRAVGAYGIAIALPQFIFTPAGPWLVTSLGARTVLILGVIPLLALLWLIPVGRRLDAQRSIEGATTVVASGLQPLRFLGRIWPALLALVLVTGSGGALLTFASQIAPDDLVTTAVLLCFTGVAAPARYFSGALTDRWGTQVFIGPFVVVSAAGTLVIGLSTATAIDDGVWLLLLGSCLLGLSYGVLQSATLVRAFRDGGTGRGTHVSVAWNVAFDVGTGAGSLVIGILAQTWNLAVAFTVTSGLTLAVAALVVSYYLKHQEAASDTSR